MKMLTVWWKILIWFFANAAFSKSCNKPKTNTTKPPKRYDQTLNTLKKEFNTKTKTV